MNIPNFSQQVFFKFGTFCFAIISIANIAGLYLDWDILPLWAIIARLGNIAFNIGLSYLFFWLAKSGEQNQDPYYKMSDEELEEFLKEKENKK